MNGINKIVIAGGGSAGWMTAATLIRAFPKKEIVVIEPLDIPIIGVGESTLGSIRTWTRFIGIDDKEFLPAVDGSLKMSIKFTDFYKKNDGGFHYPFGVPMSINDRNPITDWHIKKYFYPETPIQDFIQSLFPAAALFENKKFSLNSDSKFDIYDDQNDVAYNFDAIKFGMWLKDNYCLPKKVKNIRAKIVDHALNDEGIEYLILDDGGKIYADLFIDCTGFSSLLINKVMQQKFISYEDMLPNNRVWAARVPYKNKEYEIESFANSTAIEHGWCWNLPLWSRLGTGYVYSDKFISPDDAKEEFKSYLMSNKMQIPRSKDDIDSLEFKDIQMKVGIHEQIFYKNVVAIGLSAGFIEPLESNGLLTVTEFLFRLVDVVHRDRITQIDRDMFNITAMDFYKGFSKFIAQHYGLSIRNDTNYWKHMTNKSMSHFDGDPFTPPFVSNEYYNFVWRYMTEWGHPDIYGNNAGIAYISTGMHFFTMNERRLMNFEYRTKRNLFEEINSLIPIWEARKQKWSSNAALSPSMYQYLRDNYFN